MSPIDRVRLAQDFFRFAYLVGSPISFGLPVQLPPPPETNIFGKHALSPEDIELSKERFEFCGTMLERMAYRLLAIELNTALESKYGKPQFRCDHCDAVVRDSSIVVWVIRNAVAHNIFNPVWRIDDARWQNKKIDIPGILVFDTTGLNGRALKRFDFGGLIALFRLSEKLLSILE